MILQEILSTVVSEWSYFDKEPPAFIRRSVLDKLGRPQPDLVLAIQGVRRSGKSTLLVQMMKELKLPSDRCFFINFEDPRLSDELNSELLTGLVKFADSKVDTSAPRYFFLDEIQNVKDWEKWLRLKVDRPTKDCFVITGSNAMLLSGELASVLTGRHISVELFVFNFSEYLALKPKGTLLDYVKEGGFPRPLQAEEPYQLLRQYFTDIIERDVKRFAGGRSLVPVAKAVFESTGSELSARTLSKQFEVSIDTMLNYLDALTQAYLISACPYFTFSERKRVVRNNKWYPIDCGMLHSLSVSKSPDIGKSFETVVFYSLKAKYGEVYYWRDQGEVDFVVLDGGSPLPVQVSWDGLKERHKKALAEFAMKFPNALEPIIVSRDNFLEVLD